MRRIGILLLVVELAFGFPLIATADSSQAELEVLKRITAAAKHDANADTDADGCFWFCSGFSLALGGGCLLGALSLIPSYSYRPSPPLSRLVGKPPEYIAVYIDTYKEQRRSTAAGAVVAGCALGAATAGCLALIGVSPWSTTLQESTGKYRHSLDVLFIGISRVAAAGKL